MSIDDVISTTLLSWRLPQNSVIITYIISLSEKKNFHFHTVFCFVFFSINFLFFIILIFWNNGVGNILKWTLFNVVCLLFLYFVQRFPITGKLYFSWEFSEIPYLVSKECLYFNEYYRHKIAFVNTIFLCSILNMTFG